MRRSVTLLVVVVLVAAACGDDDGPAADEMPADFVADYSWIEGSVPPPFHYEYTIEIRADGASQITMIPDYPGSDVPEWTVPLDIGDSGLASVWRAVVDNGVFTRSWDEDPMPPVGGSSARVLVTADGTTVSIPRFLDSSADTAAADRIYRTIEQRVPPEVWDDLLGRRQAYEDAYEG